MVPGKGYSTVVKTWQTRDTSTGDYYAKDSHGKVWYVYGGGGAPSGFRTGEERGRLHADGRITRER